jgi:hypothetical protein
MAKSVRKKPYEPPSFPVTVDAWTLKCLYKLSDYQDRIANGEYIALHEEASSFRANGERSIQVYYGRQDDRLAMVRLQWFENSAGEITRSGLKEPKWMHLGGVSYHVHGGDAWWQKLRRDLTNLKYDTTSPTLIWLKKRYADWRRLKCAEFGPVEAVWRRWWFRGRPYSVYCACRDGAELGWRRGRKALKPFRSYVRRLFSGPRGHVLALA